MSPAARSERPRSTRDEAIHHAIRRHVGFLCSRQAADGTWPVPYTGPGFLLPLYVIAAYICRQPLADDMRRKMIRQLRHVQLADGSIGLHHEAQRGTLFTTVIAYVALRMLGEGGGEPHAARMRDWIRRHGGPLHAAAWGKFILCLVNLYDYSGVVPVLPELYLLPGWLPFHPRRLSGYVRIIYLPMSYFYATRAAAPVDPLIRELRAELYDQPYERIRFARHRHTRHAADDLVAEGALLRWALRASRLAERLIPSALRRRALERVHEHVLYEDRTSDFVRQAPVNALYNTLVHHFRGDRDLVERSWREVPRYLWDHGERIDMQGFTSTKLWDNAFFLQALHAAGAAGAMGAAGKTREGGAAGVAEPLAVIQRAYDYVRDHQVQDELPDAAGFHRLPRRGGWTFSEKANGWVITDCTAESIKAALLWEGRVERPITRDDLELALGFLLAMQNPDGGWGSCDRLCGGPWLEGFNAANVFLDIMIDHSFAECTASTVQALIRFGACFPEFRADAIRDAVRRGVEHLRRVQRGDGSWEACWGACFTYGTAFALQALAEAGLQPADAVMRRACDFLERHQLADGGWGEEQETCLERRYMATKTGLVEHTAWAVLALQAAGRGEDEAARRGIDFLLAAQMADGDWPPQPMCGLFYRTTFIAYENYKRYFPLLALARAAANDASRTSRPA